MLGNVDVGHLRVARVNGIPVLVSSISDYFPKQEMEHVELLTGGPRTVVYYIGKKTIRGTLRVPLYLDKDGLIGAGCREIIKCADNPFRQFELYFNFGIQGEKKTALMYQQKWSSSAHWRMLLDPCGVTKLDITVEKNGGANMEIGFVGLPAPFSSNTAEYTLDPEASGLMSRQCSFADCLITRLGDTVFQEEITNINLSFENDIQELWMLPGSQATSVDYARELYLDKKTLIGGSWEELKKSKDWANEMTAWNHGSYAEDDDLRIRFADIRARIQNVLYEPQEQPLNVGVLRKKTNFKAVFEYGWVSAQDNLVFPELQAES
jgi:hypothetical protein